MKKIMVTLGLLMSLLVATTGQAAPLYLDLNSEPDIFVSGITVGYDSTSGNFSANGFSQQFNGMNLDVVDAFSLTANINSTTGVLTNGLFSIAGEFNLLGFNSGTLLEGTITDFGFGTALGDPLEFLFTATGGDAQGLYNGLGGIILGSSSFGGDFSTYTGGSMAVADVGVVPIPAAAWLFGSALLGLIGYNRRRKTG